MRRRDPGRESYESTIHAVPADSRDPQTVAALSVPDWVHAGKASLVRMLEVVESVQRSRHCSFAAAFRLLADGVT